MADAARSLAIQKCWVHMTVEKIESMARAYAEAWCSLDPSQVAAFYAEDGTIAINGGDTLAGRAAIRAMAADFYAAFPDLKVHCDDVRVAGDHAIFVWTLEGHHAATRNFVKARGWEEWGLNPDLQIRRSAGWFDAADYQRQIDGR